MNPNFMSALILKIIDCHTIIEITLFFSEREYPNCPPPISAQQSQQNLPPRSNLITLKRPLSNTNDRKAEYYKEQNENKSKFSNKVKGLGYWFSSHRCS